MLWDSFTFKFSFCVFYVDLCVYVVTFPCPWLGWRWMREKQLSWTSPLWLSPMGSRPPPQSQSLPLTTLWTAPASAKQEQIKSRTPGLRSSPRTSAITTTVIWSCSCRNSALSTAPSHGCIPSASLCRGVSCGSWKSPTILVSMSSVLPTHFYVILINTHL